MKIQSSKSNRTLLTRILALLMTLTLALPQFQLQAAAMPSITAGAAVVMDYDTGEFLYEKSADNMMVPASMTKIMTAYIVFEEIENGNLDFDSEITISSTAAAMSRNSNYPMAVPLTSGASYTVDTLLKLIMVPSASASCYAIAEHISGSETAFVERMNETAKALGMTAEYKNCHGAQVHYMTARSVAILIQQFIQKYPQILGYTALKSVNFNGTTYANTNQLLSSSYYYEGADGFKTGTIAAAGYCLASTAIRDGRRVIGVVMKSTSTAARHTDSHKILDYGFEQIQQKDQSRASAEVALALDEIRLNSDSYISATFSGIDTPFQTDTAFTVNGEVIKEMKGVVISNGSSLSVNHCFVAATGDAEEIGFYYTMPGTDSRRWTITVPVSTAPPAMFRDIHGHWAEAEIEALCTSGLFSGSTEDYFNPGGEISLGMLVTVLGRYAEDTGATIPADTSEEPQMYYTKYMNWASQNGLISGGDGEMNPDAPVSRSMLATVLYRFSLLGDSSPTAVAPLDFSDIDALTDETKTALGSLLAGGVISGYADGTFRPDNQVTRAELVHMLSKYIQANEA